MIPKYCIKCKYCGTEYIHTVINIENFLKWEKCKYCAYNKFTSRRIESVDYYKDDPKFEDKTSDMKIELEDKAWF